MNTQLCAMHTALQHAAISRYQKNISYSLMSVGPTCGHWPKLQLNFDFSLCHVLFDSGIQSIDLDVAVFERMAVGT